MLTKYFWFDPAGWPIRAAAQSALRTLGADQRTALPVGWLGLLGSALGGALLSLLSSLASTRVGFPDSPSLVD